ncbi:hypothetical protein ERK19_04975 [Lactobacillus helsingborgensis]|uniref:ABC transporter permease n=1 Tax=Lactobacillus helsingborgensis TaxID=1218494 RepID=UPI00164F11F1|nr:ABC-2 family transporter protein [Lactobacillus helsingborgensis]MBC6356703.1 hypothetical protein [Lactobacillus helsingborgensis]
MRSLTQIRYLYKKIKLTFSIYITFSKAELKQNYLAYKSRFFLWIGSNSVTLIIQIILWMAIFDSSPSETINGYTKAGMIDYNVISKITESFTFVSFESKVSEDIDNGSIVMDLMRPIDYTKELLFRSFGEVLGSILMFSPIYILIGFIVNDFHLHFSNILSIFMYLFFILIAFLMNFFLCLLFSSFIFKTIKSRGVYALKTTLIGLLSGALIPMDMYPRFIRSFLSYSPLIYLRYVPISVITGKINFYQSLIYLFIGIPWTIILYFISKALWKRQIVSLTIFGG